MSQWYNDKYNELNDFIVSNFTRLESVISDNMYKKLNYLRLLSETETKYNNILAAKKAKASEEARIKERNEVVLPQIISAGFKGDGSMEDYMLLYDRPQKYANPMQSAIDSYEKAENKLDYFIELWFTEYLV